MQNSNLNELRQALSGAYSRELDRVISGQTTDKSRADTLKRIMDGLPVVNGREDHAVVQAALNVYRSKAALNKELAADELTRQHHQGELSDDAYDAAMSDLIDAHDCSEHIVGDGYCSQCGAIVPGTEAYYREYGAEPPEDD